MFKRIISTTLLSLFLGINTQIFAEEFNDIEHLQSTKNSKIDLVKITQENNIIQKENQIIVNFAQNFNSKYYKIGDYVQFNFNQDVKTQEGTIIIPCNSSLIAKISNIIYPKWFSKNAKVCIEFTHLLMPDGKNIPVYTQLANKDYLQEGKKETAGKILAYTFSIGAIGAGAGSAIGSAGGNTITGLIIGSSIGSGIGLIAGVVSKGLHYKAKKGESITIELKENLKLPQYN